MSRPFVAVAFVALSFAVATAAPVPKPDLKNVWVGSRVVLKGPGTSMKVKVGDGFEMVPLRVLNPTVLSETATTVEVSFAGKTGTLSKDDVVRADAAGVAYFDKRIADRPTVDLYLRRASLNKLRNELDLALADLNKAIELSPSAAVYTNRGQLQTTRKNYDAALADFNKAIQINPNDAFGYRGRAYTYEQLKKADEALADYAKANELVPDEGTHTGAGRVLASKKEWAKACEQYDAAVKLTPKHVPAYQLRATARFEMKDDKGGAADLDEVVKLQPTDPGVHVARASAFAHRALYAEADRDIRQALRLNPKHALALNLRAWLSATCPDAEHRSAERAVDSATKACEATGWKAAGYLDTLAAAYAEAGKWEEAVKWQKKALEDAALRATDGDDMKKRLALYEAKKPYREPPKWKR